MFFEFFQHSDRYLFLSFWTLTATYRVYIGWRITKEWPTLWHDQSWRIPCNGQMSSCSYIYMYVKYWSTSDILYSLTKFSFKVLIIIDVSRMKKLMSRATENFWLFCIQWKINCLNKNKRCLFQSKICY